MHICPSMAAAQRVLVVDDEKAMCIMLVELLGEAGYEARPAYGVDEALARLDAEPFTLIVSDVQMRPRSGLDLLDEVRERRLPVPVVLMSAFPSPDVERRALEQGARGFLTKPFDPGDFVEFVRSVPVG